MNLLRTRSKMAFLTCFLICLLVSPVRARLYSGSGTAEYPFIIDSAAKMNDIGNNQADWDNHFLLTADVDLAGITGTSFNMIGYYISYDDRGPFNGVFDGNGHKIMNFTYSATSERKAGIFVYVDGGGEIKNLQVVEPNVSSIATNNCTTGSLVSYMRGGTVRNCSVTGGNVSGYDYVGALVGYMFGGKVAQCWASRVEVQGKYDTGGLVGGNNFYAKISECYADCTVEGNSGIGGLIGMNRASVHNCYAGGNVTGNRTVGGFIGVGRTGEGSECDVENCYSVSEVNCIGGETETESESEGGSGGGGFVGTSYPVVGCFWDIETSGQTTSGGGTGKTSAEMQDRNTFISAGWDFDTPIWVSYYDDDYPKLAWEPYPGPGVLSIVPEPHSLLVSSNVNIDVKFSEEVFGVDANDIVLSNTAAIGATVDAPVDLGNSVWRFPVAGLIDGILDVNLASDYGDIVDANGLSLRPNPVSCSYEVFVLTPILDVEPGVTFGTDNTISWDLVPNADMYYVECSNGPNFPTMIDGSDWIYETQCDFAGLNVGQTYWYRAKARTAPDILTWSQTNQEDFENNVLDNVDISSVPGDVIVAVSTITETVGGQYHRYLDTTMVGNFFECTEDHTLVKIESWTQCHGITVQWVVYESDTRDGPYALIHTNTSGSNRSAGWSNSRNISVPLVAGRYYYIGVCSSSHLFTTSREANLHQYKQLTWGEKFGSAGFSDNYPPSPSLIPTSFGSKTFQQRLTTLKKSISGNITSAPIDFIPRGEWVGVNYSTTSPNDTNIAIDILDTSDDSLIIADVNNGEDLSWIDVNSIKLRANLSTNDTNVTPALHDWSVTYTDPTTIIESDWSSPVWSHQGEPAIEVAVKITPRALNLRSRGKWVKAQITVPKSLGGDGIDTTAPITIVELGLEAEKIKICGKKKVKASFDRAAFCRAGPFEGPIVVEGSLVNGRRFRGSDTVKIVNNRVRLLPALASYWLQTGCGGPDWCGGLDINRDGVVDFADFALLDGCCRE
jgi:hypothetical protein